MYDVRTTGEGGGLYAFAIGKRFMAMIEQAPSEILVRGRAGFIRRVQPARAARCALLLLWPLAFSLFIVYRLGRFGFAPTDQEFILAGSWRLLHGEIPHVDVVSARPMGSSILHMIDFAEPGPLFLASRVDSMLEIVAGSIALVALASGTRYLDWLSSWRTAGLVPLSAAAAIINLHTFPLMAWHTIDGLFLVAVGWYLVHSGHADVDRRLRIRTGLVFVGAAVICKQSFFPAVAISSVAIVWMAVKDGSASRSKQVRTALLDFIALGAVPFVYFVVVAAAGGLGEAVRQLTASPPVWGRNLLIDTPKSLWDVAHSRDWFGIFVIGVVVWRCTRLLRRHQLLRWLEPCAALAVIGVVALAVRRGHFAYGSSNQLFWMYAVVTLAVLLSSRAQWHRPVMILALAWMASLSWGYDTADLMGGSLAAAIVIMVAREAHTAPLPRGHRLGSKPWVAILAVEIVGVFAVGAVYHQSATVRSMAVYRDSPISRLTADAGVINPTMRGIRTSPAHLEYLKQVKDCVAGHPAAETAVLPDNAALYPALRLRNPFPSDWMYGPELVGDAVGRIRDEAVKLNKTGDYLVMFQTTDAGNPALPHGGDVALYDEASPLMSELRGLLHGRQVPCGSFIAIYAAPHV